MEAGRESRVSGEVASYRYGESQNNLYSRPRYLAQKLALEARSRRASICRTQRIHTYV
jgi:hypothetical protein